MPIASYMTSDFVKYNSKCPKFDPLTMVVCGNMTWFGLLHLLVVIREPLSGTLDPTDSTLCWIQNLCSSPASTCTASRAGADETYRAQVPSQAQTPVRQTREQASSNTLGPLSVKHGNPG